jgi:hypothetical protein
MKPVTQILDERVGTPAYAPDSFGVVVGIRGKLGQLVAVLDKGPPPPIQLPDEGLTVGCLQLNGQYADGDLQF